MPLDGTARLEESAYLWIVDNRLPGDLKIEILGPLRVLVGRNGAAAEVKIGPYKERALLALLALSSDREVSSDALVDALWSGEAPRSARKLLHIYVSHLRRSLGDRAVETCASGYALRSEVVTTDASGFERLYLDGCRARQSGDATLASALLGEALGLWRGPVLADFAYESFARPAAERFEEMRLTAMEERASADLALNRQGEIVGQLQAAVEAHPLRERLQGLLMATLYRLGRQAEALAVYDEVRRLLRDELGLAPGHELQTLHHAILDQDASLDSLAVLQAVGARTALPAPPTELIGRDGELRDLATLLTAKGTRLVTVTGPGGIGKTRLAIAVAHELDVVFEGGTVFVDLSALSDPALVTPAIADAVERLRPLAREAGISLTESIARALGARRVLLVLDNMEQLVEAGADVAALLRAAATLSVLVTSRARLRLNGEQVYSVPPLRVPALADEAELEVFGSVAAVALLVERVRSVDTNFAVNADNMSAIARICTRLEGVPLAIELAAPRVVLLSPQALLQRLEHRLPLLSDGAWDLPARQRTVRATIDWSYGLLKPTQQLALQRLALFTGGCTFAAAEHMCGPADVLDSLTVLLDNSLVRRTQVVAAPRYTMLETVREYALECLHAEGNNDVEFERMAEYLIRLAAQAEPELAGPDQVEWLEALEAEHDNLRVVLQWCRDYARGGLELELATSLGRFWYVRGHLDEGRRALEGALTRAGDVASAAMAAKGFRMASAVAVIQGDYSGAHALAESGLRLYRVAHDPLGVVRSLSNIGAILLGRGELDQAIVALDESVALSRDVPDSRLRAMALNNRGDVALTMGHYDLAIPLFEESLELLRAAGDLANVARSLFNLGAATLESGNAPAGARLLQESLTLSLEVGDKEDVIWCLLGLAAVAARVGHVERATLVLAGAASLLAEIGATMKPFERGLHDRTMAILQESLPHDEFHAAWSTGSQLPFHEVIGAARELGSSPG